MTPEKLAELEALEAVTNPTGFRCTVRVLFAALQVALAEVARVKALHEQADLDRWSAFDEVDELREQVKRLKAAHGEKP